jgi:plasmid stabilization system protein ParE
VTRTIHRDAEVDLAAAVRFYKAEAGVGVARRFVAEFERVARLLEENPKIGTPGESGRRSFALAVFPYTIIYRQTETGIRVLVVRHQRRDPDFGAQRN